MSEPFEILTNPLGQLILRRPGQDDVVDVRARQSFPWTKAGEMVSLRTSAGKEVLLVQRLADLPIGQRRTLEAWMAANSFVPTIRTIKSVNSDFGYQLWDVVTDRGPAQFKVQEREDVRFLDDGRFSIKDTDGNVYIMPPLDDLDPESRRACRIVL